MAKEKIKGTITFEDKPNLKNKYIIYGVVFVVALIVVIVMSRLIILAGYKKSAKDFVKTTFDGIKDADKMTINQYLDYDNTVNALNNTGAKSYTANQEVKAEDVENKTENENFKKFFSKITYKIANVKASKDKAEVVVEIKNKNVGDVFANYFLEAIKLSSTAALSSTTQEQIEGKLTSLIDEQLDSTAIGETNTQVTLNMVKENGEWKIEKTSSDLIDAFLPGLREKINITVNAYANY